MFSILISYLFVILFQRKSYNFPSMYSSRKNIATHICIQNFHLKWNKSRIPFTRERLMNVEKTSGTNSGRLLDVPNYQFLFTNVLFSCLRIFSIFFLYFACILFLLTLSIFTGRICLQTLCFFFIWLYFRKLLCFCWFVWFFLSCSVHFSMWIVWFKKF